MNRIHSICIKTNRSKVESLARLIEIAKNQFKSNKSMNEMDQTVSFVEGQLCPLPIAGHGGGLSFSQNGDMLLLAAISSPSEAQIKAWVGKWQAKLISESEFPSIPIFAIGSEDWLLETPCNPIQQEIESPGFLEALYNKDEYSMVTILSDLDTNIIKKINRVELDEMFIERMVLSWNPYKTKGDEYTKTYSDEGFVIKVNEIFKMRNSQELWRTSW
tara:strand:- start:1330 stop:1980 length:651 start_codon:yes stop_codon:yes gene_type:complete